MKCKVVSLNITTGKYKNIINDIISLAKSGKSSYVCVANVHMCIEAHWSPEFSEQVNASDISTPDGMPLANAIRRLYGFKQDRVAGMDLLPDVLKIAETESLGVYFYGGTEEMMFQTEKFIQKEYKIAIHSIISI